MSTKPLSISSARTPITSIDAARIERATAKSTGGKVDKGSFFSLLQTQRIGRKAYWTRDDGRVDVFVYIDRFYNLRRHHSTIGYESPMAFEAKMRLA